MLEKLWEMHELDLGEQSSTHLTFLVLMEVLQLNVFVQVELYSSGLAPSFLALDHQEHHLDIPQCLHPSVEKHLHLELEDEQRRGLLAQSALVHVLATRLVHLQVHKTVDHQCGDSTQLE